MQSSAPQELHFAPSSSLPHSPPATISKIHDMMRAYGSVLMTLERFNLGKAGGVGGANAICITSNLAPPSECNSVRNLILI